MKPSQLMFKAAENLFNMPAFPDNGDKYRYIRGCCSAISEAQWEEWDKFKNKKDTIRIAKNIELNNAEYIGLTRLKKLFSNKTTDQYWWPRKIEMLEPRIFALLYAAYDLQAEGL
jgi:hypothetical protein